MKNSSNLNISCKVVFSLNKWNKKVGSPSSFGRKRPFISLNSSASIENLSSSERARARARANHAINDAQKGCAMQLNGITLSMYDEKQWHITLIGSCGKRGLVISHTRFPSFADSSMLYAAHFFCFLSSHKGHYLCLDTCHLLFPNIFPVLPSSPSPVDHPTLFSLYFLFLFRLENQRQKQFMGGVV